MTQNLTDQKGFTLIELLVAITLLTIGIFAVISMQVTAIQSNSIANRLAAATALSQETMDDILAWDISDSRVNTNTANAVYDLNGPNSAGTNITISGAGTFSATYSTTINTPAAGTTQITVKVYKVTNGVNDPAPLSTITGCKRVT